MLHGNAVEYRFLLQQVHAPEVLSQFLPGLQSSMLAYRSAVSQLNQKDIPLGQLRVS